MKNSIPLIMIILILLGSYTSIRGFSASSKIINLVALGDSITYGSGDPAKKGYIGIVENDLEDTKNISIQVSNFAIPRYTTDNILAQLKEKKIKLQIKKANYIFLFIGTNDFRKSADYKFDQLNLKKINEGKLQYEAKLNQILDKVRNVNSSAPIILLGLYHPYVEYQNQKQILDIIEEWNSKIKKVSGNFEQVYFVPTVDIFKESKNDYFSDSLHPNSAGYQQIANRIQKKILELEGE